MHVVKKSGTCIYNQPRHVIRIVYCLHVFSAQKGLVRQGYTSILTRALPIVRYSFCVLLAAIAWCVATSNLLHYAWFLTHEWQSGNTGLPTYTIDWSLFYLPNSGAFWLTPACFPIRRGCSDRLALPKKEIVIPSLELLLELRRRMKAQSPLYEAPSVELVTSEQAAKWREIRPATQTTLVAISA